MKSQQVNKVDLSLDDIIRMDGLGQPQEQNRGGNNRGQGSQHNKRQGQGQRGFRTSGQGGGSQGLSGVSPLNRDKQGSGMNTVTNRDQMAVGGSSQRANGRTWTAKSGGGGGRQWGGQGFSGGNNINRNYNSNNRNNNSNNRNNNNNMRRQANNRPFNSSRLNSSQGNGPVSYRGQGSNNQQSSLQRGGMQNNAGGVRQDQRVATANQRLGGIGQGHGQGGVDHGHGGCLGQGNLRIRVGQAGVRGQGQTQQGLKQIGFEEKRRMAMQALREARKTIAQLDQQAARQNVVNARRGISPQPSTQLPNQGAPYQNMADDNLSVASDSSMGSSSSEHDLMGRHITSLNMNLANSGNSLRKNKQWQHKPLEEDHLDSTLTISIDNSAPFVSHSELPRPPEGFHSSPPSHHQHSPPIQAWTHPPADRQPTYHPPHNSRLSHNRHSPYHQPVSISHHADSQPLHWQPQRGSVERTSTVHSPNLRRGATPGFSRQLAQLKPTVSMRYMFQKKTFSAASTPVSLNDRFSEPEGEDAAGRKVFM